MNPIATVVYFAFAGCHAETAVAVAAAVPAVVVVAQVPTAVVAAGCCVVLVAVVQLAVA